MSDTHAASNFRVDPRSRLLGPGAADLAALMQGLRQGHSVHIGKDDGAAFRTAKEARQVLYCQTSGTSGAPKIIRRHPESWIASFDLAAQRFGITDRDSYALLGNLRHSLSLFCLLEALHIGADVACLSGVSPRRQLEALTSIGVTVLYATPTQLRLLLSAQNPPLPPTLRHVFVGGGRLDSTLRTALQTALPEVPIREFFGASETSFITMADAATPAGSVGKAYPDVDLRIGARTVPFETGEIWVSSPYLFDGYAQGQSPDTHREAGYLSIGELGYVDEAGHLFLRGRKSRVVTVSDQNVYPEEIEQVLCQHPQISQAAVLAQPDNKRGHILHAVIQCSGSVAQIEPDLRRLCRDRLGAASTPRRFQMIDRMPLLPAGKPDLQALGALLEEMP